MTCQCFLLAIPFLFRRVWTSQPMKYAILSEKVFELIGGVLPTIVRLKLLNFSGEQILYK
jgi:hypothetical protein